MTTDLKLNPSLCACKKLLPNHILTLGRTQTEENPSSKCSFSSLGESQGPTWTQQWM